MYLHGTGSCSLWSAAVSCGRDVRATIDRICQRLQCHSAERQDCCVVQVLAAQEAGAVAAVIINSEHTMMPMGEDERYSPTIPSIHIPLAAGQALRDALVASNGGLWGTLRALPDQQDSAGPKASPATAASATVPDGRPGAGSQLAQESQVAGRSTGQCEEDSESVSEQRKHERTQEMGTDDYYSPEEDTDDDDEGESSAGQGSCIVDGSAQSLSTGERDPLPASPEQQAGEQGVTTSVVFPAVDLLEGLHSLSHAFGMPAIMIGTDYRRVEA